MRCKACDSVMRVTYDDNKELETLCPVCHRKAAVAREMEEEDFDGLWSDNNWLVIGADPDVP